MSQVILKLSIIVAYAKGSRVIGRSNGEIPWRMKDDMRRFKDLTTGHPCIMGRKTYDAMVPFFKKEFLPGRSSIIVTQSTTLEPPIGPAGMVARNMMDAIDLAFLCDGADEVFVIGGGEIYKLALPYVQRMYITEVESDAEGEIVFPDFHEDEFRLVKSTPGEGEPRHCFKVFERRF